MNKRIKVTDRIPCEINYDMNATTEGWIKHTITPGEYDVCNYKFDDMTYFEMYDNNDEFIGKFRISNHKLYFLEVEEIELFQDNEDEGNITKEFTDKVGICSYETIERHREYSHTTPLFQTLLDILDGKLSIISSEDEKWEIVNDSSYTETVTYVKNRKDLYLHLSNLDLGAHFYEGSRGLYEYVLNLNNGVYNMSQIIFRKI